jgi:phytoene dehydrogenase-like protein
VGYGRPVNDVDAVVIGAGPNGLVAANLLADAGWGVLVLEAQPEPGGAVRSAELTHPGYVHDVFSAFYPLGVASPVMRGLDLESYGLRWRRSPLVLAHPTADSRCAALSTDVDETAASVGAFAASDGDAWRAMAAEFENMSGPLLDSMMSPIPPVRGPLRLAVTLGPRGLLEFTRQALLPVRRLARERFRGEGAGLLLAGNAMHSDLGPDVPLSGFLGWFLAMLGQQYGFPVPEGGSGELTAALVRRLSVRGGMVRCGAPVRRVEVRDGRAVAVVLSDGESIAARRGVLADVGAPALYRDLVGEEHLPARVVDDLSRFQYDHATFKVDWALSGPIPWRNEVARRAGTVHLADSMDHITAYAADLARDRIPARPFVLLGQMNTADPTRSPAGTETVWAYTHVPLCVRSDGAGDLRGVWDTSESDTFADRRARLPRAGDGAPPLAAAGARAAERQPGRGRAGRRHCRDHPAAGVPSRTRARPGRDTGARPVPGVVVRPPGGWCARCVRRQRGPGRDRGRPHPPPDPPRAPLNVRVF